MIPNKPNNPHEDIESLQRNGLLAAQESAALREQLADSKRHFEAQEQRIVALSKQIAEHGEILARLDALGDVLNQPKYLARLEVQRQFYPRKPKAAQPEAQGMPIGTYGGADENKILYDAEAAPVAQEPCKHRDISVSHYRDGDVKCRSCGLVLNAAPVTAHALADELETLAGQYVDDGVTTPGFYIGMELGCRIISALRGEPRG